MGGTKIEWTRNPDGSKGKVWNPITGCTPVSPGCAHCYADRQAKRFWKDRKFSDIALMSDKIIEAPLHWRKPQRIFAGSMTDFFHADIPDWWLDIVFGIMVLAPQHTFQVLTKRPERMAEYVAGAKQRVYDKAFDIAGDGRFACEVRWPLPNLWNGTTVCNQDEADRNIPFLLQTPAAVRFVSVEPMLGPVDLRQYLISEQVCCGQSKGQKIHCDLDGNYLGATHDCCGSPIMTPTLDWVICGGESGPGARPMHPEWARSLRDQCKAAGVPFMFKQHGEWVNADENPDCCEGKKSATVHYMEDGTPMVYVGKKAAGRLLDGELWDQYPVPQP